MSDPVRFLTAFSQALSTVGALRRRASGDGPQRRSRVERLQELQAVQPQLQFTFLAGEVLFGTETVHAAGRVGMVAAVDQGRRSSGSSSPAPVERTNSRVSFPTSRSGSGSGRSSSADLWQMGESSIRLRPGHSGADDRPKRGAGPASPR